jgi:post-segregation antitoxin (ccd killing protein)
MKNIKGVADFVRLRVLAGSLSKVLDEAVTRKLELERAKRMNDILSAVKKVSDTVVDISALKRAGVGDDRSRIKQDQWRESPERIGDEDRHRRIQGTIKCKNICREQSGLCTRQPGTEYCRSYA